MKRDPATITADEIALPFERTGKGQSEADAAKSLFELLDSEEENTETPNEPEAKAEAEADEVSEDEETEEVEASEEESEEDGDEEAESDDEETTVQRHTVKVDGKDLEVTLDEMKAGYSRTQDYTRKTQALATERKSLDAEKTSLAEQRAKYGQDLEVLEQVLKDRQPAEPDWDKLRKENPAEYAARWADHERSQQELAVVRSERERVAREDSEKRLKEYEAYLTEEAQKLYEAIPEWKDPKVSTAGQKEILDYLMGERGITQQEIGNVADHRLMLIFRDAARWRAHEKKAPGVKDKIREKQKAALVLKPGARAPEAPAATRRSKARDAAIKRAARTGSRGDAASAIAELLG